MFEKLLEYQRLDIKLLNLKRNLETNASKQNLNKALALAKDYKNKVIDLENKAKISIQDYEKCKVEYEKTVSELNVINKTSIENSTEEQLNANIEKANKLVNVLGLLERNLSSQAKIVEDIVKNFELYYNNFFTYKQKYKDIKAECDKIEEQAKPQFEAIKKQMLEMEKDIDKALLARYKQLKQDKIFPVVVPLNNSSCGGCNMELPAALMNKLKANGYLECEQCKRYIYI